VVGKKEGFLTGTVSDLPIQPQKVDYISKNFFLAFTAPGFWLLLFGHFGFYYSNFGFYYSNGIPYI
jgi:hypothetical protein